MSAGEDGLESSGSDPRPQDLPTGLWEYSNARAGRLAASTEVPPNAGKAISPQQERALHDGRTSYQHADYG
jgi:hypothetical protein